MLSFAREQTRGTEKGNVVHPVGAVEISACQAGLSKHIHGATRLGCPARFRCGEMSGGREGMLDRGLDVLGLGYEVVWYKVSWLLPMIMNMEKLASMLGFKLGEMACHNFSPGCRYRQISVPASLGTGQTFGRGRQGP